MAREKTGLPWDGAGPPPTRGGGFVGSIGLNQPVAKPLAVDPDGTAPPPKASKRDAPAGAQVSVEPMQPKAEDDRVRPGGRIRMPVG